MLRQTNIQRLHWADKTMSMLQRDQLEACERRLAELPDASVFDLEDDLRTEDVWRCSYDAQERPTMNELHTLQGLRSQVMANLSAEAALLTAREHTLLERLITLEGTAELIDWSEVSAAESLARRMWCTITQENGVIRVHMPQVLLTPLTLTLSTAQHQELRDLLYALDLHVHAALFAYGLMQVGPVLHALMTDVLADTYACDPSLALRYIRATYDYVYDKQGGMILLHPGLADPEKLLNGGTPLRDDPLKDTEELFYITLNGMLPGERPLVESVVGQLRGAVRPEINELIAVEDLLILAKQGVSLTEMQEVLDTLLISRATPDMRLAIAELHAGTSRWDEMHATRLQ